MDQQITQRIQSIDMLRGLVILIMLLDHVRERFFLHMQVSDPMDASTTDPALFFSRFAAHFCAPIFVFLTGLSAWLYAHPANGAPRSASAFLVKRGLFLIALEFTLITFSWMGSYQTIWLQVIWVIGLSMLALAALLHLPRRWQLLVGLALVFGHNALTPITFAPDEWGYSVWTILHDRNILLQTDSLTIKLSYPALPWFGVILLGYFAGPLYAVKQDPEQRRTLLLWGGVFALALLLVLRGFNIYGESLPWQPQATLLQSAMSFLNFTKYPASLHFLLVTLGAMCFLLRWMEQWQNKLGQILMVFGSVPMFFYILHLYVLLVLYCIAIWLFGANYGQLYGVDHISTIWIISISLSIALYWPTLWFSRYKHNHKKPWLSYL
ncbi:heparan-alpha-glucosaminide N-acetyltransferase domain-containing protein [Alishewanella sp. 16-MA]|uniref:Heparan-alpha-glucosaminide N-acetyltransferase domain-containing protein n=1 Tax=Alishewanella maricola TaxID=2795740 RepID=A0ABS8C3N3_9ALTE|nr:heparan-alpha-glucosaminide N-acetyltransferase domain-containing protein [Alishewanella maricola]MCB5226943.1 heparan-alpha-glucosaminide N-acetyltransferase domain-containing protein [Alishewanella maricola]